MNLKLSRFVGGAALLLLGGGLRVQAQTPYSGTPAPIPGIIQACNFDLGGQDVAYHDNVNVNRGGQYRAGEGVSIEFCSEGNNPPGAGNYDVGYCDAGDWLKYTVSVAATTSYNIGFRVAAPTAGGAFHLEVDGTDVTGPLQIPGSGGYQAWTTVYANNVTIASGQHILRLSEDALGPSGVFGNFHFISFAKALATPPAAPAALTAIAGNISAYLSWTASAGAVSYNVKRSAVSGGSYTTISAPGSVTATTFNDSGLTNGTTYYYVVTAVNSAGESGASNQVAVTPKVATTLAVHYTFDGGPANGATIPDVTGNGNAGAFVGGGTPTDFYDPDHAPGSTYSGTTDAAAMRYISFGPNFHEFTNQFSFFAWVKMAAGSSIQTIIANALPGDASGFKLYVNHYNTSDGALFFEDRAGGGAPMDVGSSAGVFPLGDGKFHAVALVADKLNAMATIYLDGVAVASGPTRNDYNTGSSENDLGQFAGGAFLSTSKFDDVRVYRGLITAAQVAALSGLVTAPGAPTNLTGVAGNGSATLTWTGVSNATYNVKRSLTSGGTYTTIATGVIGTTYTDAGLNNGTTYYYVVSASNPVGESANSNQAAVTPIDTTKLVVHYTFEDGPANGNTTITDTSGNGNNGAFMGGGDLTLGFSTDKEQGNYAASTDPGVPRYVAIGSAFTDFTSQFSIFVYAKIANNFNIQAIFANAGGGGSNGFKIFVNSYNTQDGKLTFETSNGGISALSSPAGAFPLGDGKYHAVAVVADKGNGVATLYLDGVVVASGATMTNYSAANTGNDLGQFADGGFGSTSLFDDFRVYQGLLTAQQIAALSVQGATVTGSVSLEGVLDLSATSPNAPLGVFDIQIRAHGSLTPLYENKTVTLTTTHGSPNGKFSLTVPNLPAGNPNYDVWIKGGKNLATLVPGVALTATGGTAPNALLLAGDTDNNNLVDPTDFGIFVGAYNTDSAVVNGGYDVRADFNFDGIVDPTDFGLFVGNYNTAGAP